MAWARPTSWECAGICSTNARAGMHNRAALPLPCALPCLQLTAHRDVWRWWHPQIQRHPMAVGRTNDGSVLTSSDWSASGTLSVNGQTSSSLLSRGKQDCGMRWCLPVLTRCRPAVALHHLRGNVHVASLRRRPERYHRPGAPQDCAFGRALVGHAHHTPTCHSWKLHVGCSQTSGGS